jgi:glycosyltransferase involved in cell wall biosynthesis
MALIDKPIYSICVTNFNSIHSLRQSIESLLLQVDSRFEIIVVDNQSHDGSLDILRYYQKIGKIKLIIRPCSRGLGRQIGVQHSRGKYIITQTDMDDVFEPRLNELLKIYHSNFEGYLLLVQGQPGLIVAPKELIDRVGGYRDLNWLEDKDLYSRVAAIGRFRFLKSFRIIAYTISHPARNQQLRIRIQKQYLYCREAFRLNDIPNPLRITDELCKKKPYMAMVFPSLLLIFVAAFITHWFYPQVHNNLMRSFDADDHVKMELRPAR